MLCTCASADNPSIQLVGNNDEAACGTSLIGRCSRRFLFLVPHRISSSRARGASRSPTSGSPRLSKIGEETTTVLHHTILAHVNITRLGEETSCASRCRRQFGQWPCRATTTSFLPCAKHYRYVGCRAGQRSGSCDSTAPVRVSKQCVDVLTC